MNKTVSATVSTDLEARLTDIYGTPRHGLTEDVVFALRIARKRKTPIPTTELDSTVSARGTVGITLTPDHRKLLKDVRGVVGQAAYLRSILNWMLGLKTVKDRQEKRSQRVVTTSAADDYNTMRTTLDNAAAGSLSNATIATAFMGLSIKLGDLATAWGVDRDRALIMAIGLAHDGLKVESL